MKVVTLTTAGLFLVMAAQADFSYSATRRTSAGASVAGNSNQPSKYFFKGQKIKIEKGDTAMVFDFAKQTVTTFDYREKTISVKSIAAAAANQPGDENLKTDVRETGQTKIVNGHRSSEFVLTTPLDSPELQTMGSRLQMEMDLWLARDIPGSAAAHDLVDRNAQQFPWQLLSGNGNPAVLAGLSRLQRKLATMNGIQVLEVIRVKPVPGLPASPLSHAEMGRARDRIAELDAQVQKGGPAATAATREMSELKAKVGDDLLRGPLFEITIESRGFSAAPLPDSLFAAPAGYRQAPGYSHASDTK